MYTFIKTFYFSVEKNARYSLKARHRIWPSIFKVHSVMQIFYIFTVNGDLKIQVGIQILITSWEEIEETTQSKWCSRIGSGKPSKHCWLPTLANIAQATTLFINWKI